MHNKCNKAEQKEIIKRALIGQVRFMFRMGFVFLVLSVTRCRPPHSQVVVRLGNIQPVMFFFLPKVVEKLIHADCHYVMKDLTTAKSDGAIIQFVLIK